MKSGALPLAVLAGLFFSALLSAPVGAQESGGGTLVEEKTWALISVSLGGAFDVKQEVRQGWKYNGTVFSGRAHGGLSLAGSVGGTPNVSYFDYDTRVLVRKDSKVLLDQPAKVSKDGGSQSFSLSVDPSPGTVEIELTITGGNPEFFTRYVKGTVTIEAPPTPTPTPRPPPTQEPDGEPTAEEEPRPEPTPPPLRASVDVSPSSLAADGQSLATLTATCTDAQGRPAIGASVRWQIGPRLAASEQGGLDGADAVDGSGRARATYSAPLLEATGFQEVGEAKSRTISVECAYGGQTASASAGLSLLRTALVELVVEKPGVETYRKPIRIGSLNGSITGRLMLQARDPSGGTGTTDRPLNDASVRLAGKVLGPAAIDAAASADNGDFTVRLLMNEWKPWKGSFGSPIVLRPSSGFKAREARVLQHLGEWGGGAEVHERTWAFVWGSEILLADLPARETPGLASKLQIAGWMLLVLKSGEDEGRQGIGEFLGHTLELVKAVASYCFEESKLSKWMDDRFKGLQKGSGIYALRVRYAKWLKSQGTLGSLRTRVWQWLSVRVTGASSTPSETRGAGHLQRMAIDKVIVAKIVEILSDGATEMVQSQTEGLTGAVTDRITGAILSIYRNAGDGDLLLFLDNRNYAHIEAVSVSVEARLSARKGRLDRERFTVEQRRIAHDSVATLFGTISEFGQAVLRVTGVGTGQAELIFLANDLEKLHERIATATEAVRFGEEAWNLARIYSRAEQVLLEAVAEAAGVASAPSASLAPRPTNRFDLLPVAHADEGDTFDLAAGLDPLLLTLEQGKAKPDLALTLSILEAAMAGWRSELQPKLLAMRSTNEASTADLAEREAEWQRSVAIVRFMGLHATSTPLTSTEQQRWKLECARLEERTRALQAQIDAVIVASADIDPAPEVAFRKTIEERLSAEAAVEGESPPPAASEPEASFGPSPLLIGGIVAAVLVLLGAFLLVALLGVWLYRRSARRPGSVATRPAPYSQPRLVAPHSLRLADASGRRFELHQPILTLGSAPDNDIVIESATVSRHHVRILRSPDGHTSIEDLGSTNGTRANGIPVTTATLSPGTTLDLGEIRLWVEQSDT